LALGNARDVLDYLGKKNPFSGKGTVKGRRRNISKGKRETCENDVNINRQQFRPCRRGRIGGLYKVGIRNVLCARKGVYAIERH
jgi:hypothetical protein